MALNSVDHEDYFGTVPIFELEYGNSADKGDEDRVSASEAGNSSEPETQMLGFPNAATATEMGRKGGSSRTLAKRLAAKANGKLGGRPKKTRELPSQRSVVAYDDIAINKKTWSTFSPQRMAEYKEEIFYYYRQTGFPFYKLTAEEKQKEYDKLLSFDYTTLIEGEIINQVMHGLSLAWAYHPHQWSVKCGNMLSPVEVFRDDTLFRKAIEKRIAYGDNISDSAIRKTLRTFSGTQAVSNFRPTAAAAIYHRLLPESGGTVYDPSAGFGGRLLGALICTRVFQYIAADPSTASWHGCQQMAHELNPRGIPVQLVNCGSENFRPDPESIDLAFTSPPYFDTEKYSDEPTQSFAKFANQDDWLNGFMKRTLENCRYGLKDAGQFAINIANVKSYPTLEADFLKLATANGFRLVRTLRLALSKMMGTRNSADTHKYEPVFVFKKA